MGIDKDFGSSQLSAILFVFSIWIVLTEMFILSLESQLRRLIRAEHLWAYGLQ